MCKIADINTSRYDVILPQDVVNQLHERSDVKVNSVLIGAVTVNTACDDVAVSPVVSHCEGDVADVPVITDNKPVGQSYVSEGSQRRKLEVTPRSLLVVRKGERKTLEPTWWCKYVLVCVMTMMIMMNMMLMTKMMMMMRLPVSEMCFSGLLSNRVAVSIFEQSGSRQQDQLIHTLDEYADCIDVGRDLEDDLLRYNTACVCCGYNQLTLEIGCCWSTPVSRSGQLCPCRIPGVLSEWKSITSPWTRTVGHGTRSAVELDLSTASTVVREEMFTLQVNTVEEL